MARGKIKLKATKSEKLALERKVDDLVSSYKKNDNLYTIDRTGDIKQRRQILRKLEKQRQQDYKLTKKVEQKKTNKKRSSSKQHIKKANKISKK